MSFRSSHRRYPSIGSVLASAVEKELAAARQFDSQDPAVGSAEYDALVSAITTKVLADLIAAHSGELSIMISNVSDGHLVMIRSRLSVRRIC